jgi:hypothetical protein
MDSEMLVQNDDDGIERTLSPYILTIVQPDHITEEMYRDALLKLESKRDNPAISGLRFESFREGLCLQIMHVGPYDDEPRTVEKMRAFARENGFKNRKLKTRSR